jgi:hypothetical protein
VLKSCKRLNIDAVSGIATFARHMPVRRTMTSRLTIQSIAKQQLQIMAQSQL